MGEGHLSSIEFRTGVAGPDGQVRIAESLLKTSDFGTFRISQLGGPAAANKGMALFPRRINGRYVALSRWSARTTR